MREGKGIKRTNSRNKWIINGYLTGRDTHTQAALVNASPWATYKTTLVKVRKKIHISTNIMHILGSILLKSVLLNG